MGKKYVSKRVLWRVGDTRMSIASRTIKGEQVYVTTLESKGGVRPTSQKFYTLGEAMQFANSQQKRALEQARA